MHFFVHIQRFCVYIGKLSFILKKSTRSIKRIKNNM
jgi:hypothetical protein